MATSRYTFVPRLNGERISTTDIGTRIFFACQNNTISFNFYTLVENQRIDQIASQVYSDGRLWWIIASASGIGWSLQCPAGTVIRIPTDLNQVYELLR